MKLTLNVNAKICITVPDKFAPIAYKPWWEDPEGKYEDLAEELWNLVSQYGEVCSVENENGVTIMEY